MYGILSFVCCFLWLWIQPRLIVESNLPTVQLLPCTTKATTTKGGAGIGTGTTGNVIRQAQDRVMELITSDPLLGKQTLQHVLTIIAGVGA